MGNTTPSSQTTSQLINKHWQPISPMLWKNKATNQLIKQKRLVFKSQQQMKYVFNCLVRRMNNYHPNVLKVFYLRKNFQKGSLCNCGQRHSIQVYVENVDYTLENYVTVHSKSQQINKPINGNNSKKCVCMQILKAALYLKQRYGPFIVSQTNIRMQQPNVEHHIQDHRFQFPGSSIQKSSYYNSRQQPSSIVKNNTRAKLWISTQQQQNFPDHSCQEKDMCKSIIDLIKNVLVRNGLCVCYPNIEVLERFFYFNTLRELEQIMSREHDTSDKSQLLVSKVQKIQQKVPFTRTLRSYSAQDSSCHPQPYITPNMVQTQNRAHQLSQQQSSQRKYSSIQYVRKPMQKQHLNMNVGRKTQIMINPVNNLQVNLVAKEINVNENYSSKIVKQNKVSTDKLEQKLIQQNNTVNFHNLRTAQIINYRTQYRHGNNFINRQIINIADMTGNNNVQLIGNQPSSLLKTDRQKQAKKEVKVPEQIKQTNVQNSRYRSSSHYENGNVQLTHIDFNGNEINKMKYNEVSQDKGTSPTDRTKFDLSLKQEEKKQQQAINTSRKNISIIPISMQSTSGAGSILKPIIYSHDHLQKIEAQNRDFEQQIIQKNQQSVQDSKQKKQSASSSKSQQNYRVHHQILTNSKKFEYQQKRSIIKKRMSDSQVPSKKGSEGNISKQQLNMKQSTKKQKQFSQSGLNKLQDWPNVIGNSEQMGRLRKSQYIVSEQNSQINSKKSSRKQSKDIKDIFTQQNAKKLEVKNELTSLALMAFKFKTNVSLDQSDVHLEVYQQGKKNIGMMAKQGVSIRECASGELREYEANELIMKNRNQIPAKDVQKQSSERINEKSTDMLQKLKQTPQSSIRESIKDEVNQSQKSSSVQQSLQSIQFQPQTFSKISHSSPQYQAQSPKINKKQYQITQLIKRETQRPSIMSSSIQRSQQQPQPEEYQININKQQTYFYLDSIQSLERQKQMSHPLLTQTNMVKKLSLKEEFNQLLNFDDDNNDEDYSYRKKAHTQQNKYKKRLKLDQKQGKQTVSIYNESQYNHSDNVSKRASQKDFLIKLANPPLGNRKKQINTVSRYARQNKIKKPISKHQLDKEMVKKKTEQIMMNNTEFTQPTPQQILRLTSSGHQDNSIKQKVISKKAQFAQLKNQMNNLLL